MHDSPFMIDRQLSGYSLTDMDSPSHEQLHVSNSGIWDPYNSPLGADSGRDHDSRNSYGFSLGGQHLSGQRLGAGTLHQQQQQQQQNWPRSPRTAFQGSGQGSPFASAFTGIGGEPRGIALPPLASAGHLFADSTKPGAIGQKLQRSHLSTLSTPTDANGAYNNRDQARSAFSGFNASGSAASIAGKIATTSRRPLRTTTTKCLSLNRMCPCRCAILEEAPMLTVALRATRSLFRWKGSRESSLGCLWVVLRPAL
ncbi:hypothetical protein BX661DRAFT_33305 [Kickxella alabastrina]|uniref:uncharacterized protein n=1 Tax=Kickxella alabastrina TaxID=61397 RepID=UPI00221ED5B1|nr:uncharacterized protein BX661DRAFT_33305 [Kickxella alabastrina]KAI7826396.1 hypothetical protein BX661DRAFT_33305 [Kickxella alabastrina]